MLRRLLGNFTVPGKEELTSVGLSIPVRPSPTTPPSVVVAAISGSETIPTNPSSILTDAAAAVVTTTVQPSQHVYNSTVYLAENDELEYSILAAFSDMETVFLACISTLLPLIVALGIAFGIRHVWRKYIERRSKPPNGLPWYRDVCSRDNVDSLHHRRYSGCVTIQPATQILSAEDLANGIDGPRYICETEVMEEVALAGSNAEYVSPGNHTSKNANGNIITLTLKNNHLIVETEERAVTMEDTRSRKYQDNGCSFVVEVQPGYQDDEAVVNKGSSGDMTGTVTDQQALVHREEIPEDLSAGFDNAKLLGRANTGLSQSDLSICSQGSVNPSYRYGNQLEYDVGHFEYPMYTVGNDLDSHKGEGASKWVEFDKSPDTEKTLLSSKTPSIEKDVSENSSILERQNNTESSQDSGSSLEHQDSTDLSSSIDTVVSNPNLQVNGSTPNKLEIMEQKFLTNDLVNKSETTKPMITGAILKEDNAQQEDTFQEQQRKLGNGTLTPEHGKKDRGLAFNKENLVTKAEGSAFIPCHKRSGSIPPRLIEEGLELERKKGLDIYSQIKTSTKSILPTLSPKFELLQNEISPSDDRES